MSLGRRVFVRGPAHRQVRRLAERVAHVDAEDVAGAGDHLATGKTLTVFTRGVSREPNATESGLLNASPTVTLLSEL